MERVEAAEHPRDMSLFATGKPPKVTESGPPKSDRVKELMKVRKLWQLEMICINHFSIDNMYDFTFSCFKMDMIYK